jgi:hypothetical protein
LPLTRGIFAAAINSTNQTNKVGSLCIEIVVFYDLYEFVSLISLSFLDVYGTNLQYRFVFDSQGK